MSGPISERDPIDRASPLPLWAQIVADLDQRITTGEFSSALPSDGELMEYYGVSRHTVRDAVRRLHDRGVVSRARGRETQLVSESIEQELGFAYSFFRSVESRGHDQRSIVRHLEARASEEVASHLDLPPASIMVYLERVRLVDGSPVAVDAVWLPTSIARPLLGADFSHTSVYEELARLCHVRPESGSERIRPVAASAVEAELLEVVVGEPLLQIERRTTSSGDPLEYRSTVFRGDRFTHFTEWGGSVTASKLRVDVHFAG